MPNPHMTTQDWFYHVTAPRSTGPSYIMVKPASQIPGLSDLPDEPLEAGKDDRHCKRKWFRDTDSKYIRLAKAGGRKNLLTFNNDPKLSKEPVLYPRVDWFDHDHVEDEDKSQENNTTIKNMTLPEWYIHDQPVDEKTAKEQQKSAEPAKRPMLGFDSKTAWERDEEKTDKELESKNAHSKFKKKNKKALFATKHANPVKVKLPKLKSGEDSSDLDMKKLLSMEYQKEWLISKSEEDTKEAEIRQAIKKEKEDRHNESMQRQKKIKSKKHSQGEKPLFKLSRFSKIKPCVDTRWAKLETSKKSVTQ